MILHSVLFRLKRPVSEFERSALLEGLRSFAVEPPMALGSAEVDASLGLRGESPRTADAALLVRFPDAEAFDSYIKHPLHDALVQEVLTPNCEGWWSVQVDKASV